MSTVDKRKALRALAGERRRSTWPGYKNIGDYHDGYYDCWHVSPYEKSAGNVDSPVMVFLQDWMSDEIIGGPRNPICRKLGYEPTVKTNENLIKLLHLHFRHGLGDIFATNLFPFIKRGSKNAPIPLPDLKRAAEEFGIPQMQIVRPKLVICLGLDTFDGLRMGCGLDPFRSRPIAIRNSFRFEGIKIWCQAHTSPQGQNSRGAKKVQADWQRMANEHENGIPKNSRIN